MTIQEFLSLLDNVAPAANGGWTASCPAHDDTNPSLSVATGDDGQILITCHAGCTRESIVASRGLQMRDLFASPGGRRQQQRRPARRLAEPRATDSVPTGLTLAALAEAKALPLDHLLRWGLSDARRRRGAHAVKIPYCNESGEIKAVRYRHALSGPARFSWGLGDKVLPYGLARLDEIRDAEWVLVVEGESDAWTGSHHGIPVIGIPGKATWRRAWSTYFTNLTVYLWEEPDARDFSRRVAADLPDVRIIRAPSGRKDLSEAHLQGENIPALLDQLKALAVTIKQLQAEDLPAQLDALQEAAAPIRRLRDPIEAIRAAIIALGYGGDPGPALITYLAASSRLLAMRGHSMPVHLILVGLPSSGKSYTLKVVLLLLPPEAYHMIDAGSPRILIYDKADLQHRALVFGEVDSLPAEEDNPAASAIRTLLQEHVLRYKVTVRDPSTGEFRVQEIEKPGPTVLLTTGIRRLRAQMDSRLFSLDIPDDHRHVLQALRTQAALELHGRQEPDPALIAFQRYLQARAPWDVVVPFADVLVEAIGRPNAGPRIHRDFSRLLSLVKAVTILRHAHRDMDAQGRYIARTDDYALVYALVGSMYESSVSGASDKIRTVVEAVRDLRATNPLDDEHDGRVTVTRIARHLSITKMAVSRSVRTALENGWLVDTNPQRGRGQPADLRLGDTLPDRLGLPAPDVLTARWNPGATGSEPGAPETPPSITANDAIHPPRRQSAGPPSGPDAPARQSDQPAGAHDRWPIPREVMEARIRELYAEAEAVDAAQAALEAATRPVQERGTGSEEHSDICECATCLPEEGANRLPAPTTDPHAETRRRHPTDQRRRTRK
jgi:hypothetical protein